MQTSTTEPPEVTQVEREENHNPSDVISVEVKSTFQDGTIVEIKATVPVDVYSTDREIEQAGKLLDVVINRIASHIAE